METVIFAVGNGGCNIVDNFATYLTGGYKLVFADTDIGTLDAHDAAVGVKGCSTMLPLDGINDENRMSMEMNGAARVAVVAALAHAMPRWLQNRLN